MTNVKLPRLLDADLRYKATLHPIDTSIDESLEPLSTASMTLPPDEIAGVHDYMELYTKRGFEGVYRVASSSRTYTGESTLELEHAICVLGDGVIPGEGEITGSAMEVFIQMLAHQVTQANGQNLWQVGSVDGGDTAFEHDYHNILTAIIETVSGLDGRMLTFDQTVFPWTLGTAQMETTPSCEARLSRNIASMSVTYDDSDLCTRLYCDDLEGDVKYIDGPTIGVYGVICKTIRAGENVTQESLRDYMERYLDEHKDPSVAIEIDAIDLSAATGEAFDRLDVGRLCRIALPDYGVTLSERIIARHTANVYGEPERVRLSLANRIRDTAQNFVRMQNDTTGGTSHNSATGGRYVGGGGGGSGLTQKSLLDMLKAEEVTLDEFGWTLNQAQIELDAHGVRLSASEMHLDEALGRLATAEAEIIVQAGEISARATYEDVGNVRNEVGLELNALEATVSLKASQTVVDELGETVRDVSIELDAANDEIALKANKTYVETLIAEQIDAVLSDVQVSIADSITTRTLNVSGSAKVGSLLVGSSTVKSTTIPIVTKFTQASGETAETTNYTLLTAAAEEAQADAAAAGVTKTF